MPKFTIFPDLSGTTASEHDTNFDGLSAWLRDATEYPTKAACPLISLARYGDRRSDKNSLRHDANILATTGLTGDYDQGDMPPSEAAAILELAGVSAVIATTPRHGTLGNRWRAIVPFAQERTAAERHVLMGKLNALLGGVLATESFTASQSFYFGRVQGAPYEVHIASGMPIDQAPGIDQIRPVGPPAAQPRNDADPLVMLAKLASGGIEQIRRCLAAIPNTEPDWEYWNKIGMAVYGATGGTYAGLEAWREWSDKCPVAGNTADSVDARWEHYHGSPPTAIGTGSLVHMAKEHLTAPLPPAVSDAPTNTLPFLSRAETINFMSARATRLIRYSASWLAYNPAGHYEELSDEAIRSEVRRLTPWQLKLGEVNETIDELKSALEVRVTEVDIPGWLDSAGVPDLNAQDAIVCANGILDPYTGHLHPQTDKLLTFNALPYAFDPQARVPARWLRFLNEICAKDSETIRELQKIFGYFLTTKTDKQQIYLLVGPKRSGKGTLVRVLRALLGAGNICSGSFQSLSGEFGLMPFIGKQLAVFPDARVGSETKRATIIERLLSISGQDPISVNRKSAQYWQGSLNTRILILSNEMPVLQDDSGALVSRYVPIHTPVTFYGREDHNLIDALLEELPGILNWALEGLRALYPNGRIHTPKQSLGLLDEMDSLGSPVKGFVKSSCRLEAGQFTSHSTLWQEYRRWHVACGIHSRPLSSAIFHRALRTAYPTQIDNYPCKMYHGIALANTVAEVAFE